MTPPARRVIGITRVFPLAKLSSFCESRRTWEIARCGIGTGAQLLQSLQSPTTMKCPFCGFSNDKVVDSRESKEADSIRRRRECLKCEKRFTTYERIDEIPYMVVKKDGRREKFDRQKVLNGLLRACEKRPVPISKLEQIVNDAEAFVIESAERERKTCEVGELIMNRLRRYDKVAYVRFASVYLDFKDVQEFMSELKDLLKTKESEPQAKTSAKPV